MRLFIYGSPGAGKTTLAKTLARATGYPAIHLDDLFHLPKGGNRPRADALARLDRLTAEPSWIAEGNHGAALQLCADRASRIAVLQIGPWRGLARMVRRRLTDGTPLPRHLIRYVLTIHPKIEPHHLARLEATAPDRIQYGPTPELVLQHLKPDNPEAERGAPDP